MKIPHTESGLKIFGWAATVLWDHLREHMCLWSASFIR